MSDMVNDVADKFIEIGESYVLTKEEMDYLKQTAKDEMDYYLKQTSTSEKAVAGLVKTAMAKIVTSGDCCVCGEPLDNGLFLCKKCAEHTEGIR